MTITSVRASQGAADQRPAEPSPAALFNVGCQAYPDPAGSGQRPQAILDTSGRQRVKLAIAVECHQRIDRPLPVLARTPPVSSIIQGEPQGS